MNPNTGHLMNIYGLDDALPAGYEIIPQELERAAAMKLNGAQEVIVSLTSGGKLSNWAKGKRKAKAKMAAASRRKNRK